MSLKDLKTWYDFRNTLPHTNTQIQGDELEDSIALVSWKVTQTI